MTICDFTLWPEQDEQGRYEVPILSRWRMQEQHSGERGLPQVKYAFLEARQGDEPRTLIDRWAYFFREAANLSAVASVLAEDPFRAALEVTRTASLSSREWEVCERAKMAEQGARGALAVAYQEGFLEGSTKESSRLAHRSTGPDSLRPSGTPCFACSRREFALTDDVRARIAACADIETLDRWFDRALAAGSIDDAFP